MGKICFGNQTTPATPNASQTCLFVDTADKHIKTIDDSGTVVDLTLTATLTSQSLTTGKIWQGNGSNNPAEADYDIGALGTGTLAELNAIVSDATLDDSGDTRTPNTHASSHSSGGSDAITLDNLNGTLSILKGGTGQTSKTAAFDALSPSTTKGDVIAYDGSDNVRVAIGSDKQVLTADSSSSAGVKWARVFPSFQFFADQMENPVNADWALNSLAPAAADSNNNGLTVRLFDDTTNEGIGFSIEVPTGATNIEIGLRSRAETAPATVSSVIPLLYTRQIANNSSVTSWSSPDTLTAISLPTNEYFQFDIQTITLATLSLTTGVIAQFQLARDASSGSDDLSGDWTLLEVKVDFS